MRVPEPILTAHLFTPLNAELVSLLRGLSPDEWKAPTAAAAWTVKDVAAHLLDTALRRLALQRDGHTRPLPFDPNATNREWVEAARRLSPRLLVEMLDEYGRQQAEYFASLDPDADAMWPVQWAGDERSPVWFDLARELTERWHHQQQIRDAVARAPLYDEKYFAPVIDTFMRGLPNAYRDLDAPRGTAVVLQVTGEGDGVWSLLREDGRWSLYADRAANAAATVTVRGDSAWRMFTRARAREEARVEGDDALAQPLLRMVCVI
jgi:uncharacterized protein (TIGR03083 family)